MLKRLKFYTLIILITTIICSTLFYSLSQSVNAYSYSSGMCVLEGNTNTILYSSAEHKKLAMASTTKIITAILAIENTKNLNEIVTVNEKAVGIEGTSIYLHKNEQISVNDLLYGLILASGNDAALALSYHIGQTEENFVNMMNEFAIKVGATNTHFDNPHGLDSSTHYTTAYDLAIMTSYALKNATFKEIVSTKHKQLPGTEHSGERFLKNKNKLVFYQPNNVGVKTGFTDNAGRCLVNAVEENDMQIITVVLNCGPMFEEARRLTNLALQEYTLKEFVLPYNYVGSVNIENGEKNTANIVSIKGYKMPIKIYEEAAYETIYDIPDRLQAPINKNDAIGEVRVYYKGEMVYSEKLYTIDDIKNIDTKYILNNIIEKWF